MRLTYKEFVWPNDPQTYREVLSREPQYTTSGGTSSYSGMGAARRVISGSGAFFGEDAYDQFQALMDQAEDNTPGTLMHPVWGSRYCYLTRLELLQEPRENFVSYSFEMVQARPDGSVPK